MHYTFDDYLIEPRFSAIASRSEVDLSCSKFYSPMLLPIFSANMKSITGLKMANEMAKSGGVGVLHRFLSVDENCQMFMQSAMHTAVSVGIGEKEKIRVQRLLEVGAFVFFLDVAHGAQAQVAEAYNRYKKMGCKFVIVGNFASPNSYLDFCGHLDYPLDAIKVGVGPGAACSTRIKTGIGVPQMSAIMNIRAVDRLIPLIADGGVKSPGDIAKALAAGADAVMIGGMLAGTDCCAQPGIYAGSASLQSYQEQGKASRWRTAEGESFIVEPQGLTKDVLQDIEGGLRSAFAYVGARDLFEFKKKAKLIQVSRASAAESAPHFQKKS